MTDTEFMGLMSRLLKDRINQCVDKLLTGNDTCCFSTEQFQKKYLELYDIGDYSIDWLFEKRDGIEPLARTHLKKCKKVIEVKPDIWTSKIDY